MPQKVNIIQNYLNYCENGRKLAVRTCEEYGKSLRKFENWMKGQSLQWQSVTPRDIQKWQMSMRHLSGATVNERVSAVRCFYDWLKLVTEVENNPADGIRSARVVNKPRATADARAIIARAVSVPARSRTEQDAIILAAILADTGARLHEVTSLTWEQIDLECMSASILGKGGRVRSIYFTEATALLLGACCQPCGRVFDEYGDRHFRYLLRRYFGVSPHTLRHTKATDMLKAGAPLAAIKIVLGHSSVRTTEKYLQPDEEYKRAIYDQYRTT